MKILFLWIFFSITFFVSNSCKDNPVDPVIEPGRRDYTWTVDTIKFIPYSSLDRLSGSSPQDVWAVQPGGDLDKTIWRFNGNEWGNDGIARILSPLSVWGLSENNVWLGGREGRIWHYDGNSLKESIHFETSIEKYIGFQDIWGVSPSNIFAVGYSGFEENRIAVIANYNGSEWKLTEFTDLRNYNFLRIRRANTDSNTYYLWAIKDDPINGDLVSIFEYKGGTNIKLIYEGLDNSNTWAFIQKIDNEMFFVTGNKINKYVDNQFVLFRKITEINFGLQIFGRNEKDIFLRMFDGIAHYNGSNVEYIYTFNNELSIRDAAIFEKEVFFLANDFTNGLNLIIHGKLN